MIEEINIGLHLRSLVVSLVKEDGKKCAAYDVNLRYVYGIRSIRKGQTGGKIGTGWHNEPSAATRFIKYNKLVGK